MSDPAQPRRNEPPPAARAPWRPATPPSRQNPPGRGIPTTSRQGGDRLRPAECARPSHCHFRGSKPLSPAVLRMGHSVQLRQVGGQRVPLGRCEHVTNVAEELNDAFGGLISQLKMRLACGFKSTMIYL